MKIRSEDYQEVLDYMVAKRWEGYEVVVFSNKSGPTELSDLTLFRAPSAAEGFCRRMSTGEVAYDYEFIRSVYRTLADGLERPEYLIINNGIIDVSATITARYDKLRNEQILNNENTTIMNQRNADYLTNQVYYTGFDGMDNKIREQLEDPIASKRSTFSVLHEAKERDDMLESKLNFVKSKQSDMHFFNSVDVTVKSGGSMKVNTQNFRIDSKIYRDEKGDPLRIQPNITRKEAYNLMSGRAVRKDVVKEVDGKIEVTKPWITLDFKETDNKGNYKRQEYPDYNLEQHLNYLPLKELQNEQYLGNLIDSVERGNRQQVTALKDDAELVIYVEANPKFDDLSIYDENMKRVSLSQVTTELDARAEALSASKGAEINENSHQTEQSTVQNSGVSGTHEKPENGQTPLPLPSQATTANESAEKPAGTVQKVSESANTIKPSAPKEQNSQKNIPKQVKAQGQKAARRGRSM